MSIMDNEDQFNRDLISALSASDRQPSVPGYQSLILAVSEYNLQLSSTVLVVRPPSGASASTGVIFDPLT